MSVRVSAVATDRNHDMAVTRFQRSIDNQDIAGENARSGHALPGDADIDSV